MQMKAADTRVDRNRLIADHAAVARRISLRMARRFPAWISREDLVAAGMLGLTEAAARYDGDRKEPFISFAEKRIRGAVLDELRRGDIMPRRVRQMARKVTETIAMLEREHGTMPDDVTVAAALGVPLAEYKRDLEQLVHVTVDAFETDVDGQTDNAESVEDQVGQRMMLRKVEAAIAGLDRRDVELLSCCYQNELTYGETGKRMGVTTSRVCQLHGRAIDRLRTALGYQVAEAA
jgi:RNA polymerase sigma factor for flagellar operon FliA